MSYRFLRVSAVLAVLLTIGPMHVNAHAGATTIYQAIIGEADQKAPEISTEQMRQILADGSATIIDARPHKEFVNGHIPAALNPGVPADQAVGAVEKLVGGDKSKALVLYCNGPFCEASRRLSGQLLGAGFTNVRRYQLGMPIWRALGGPTVIELEGVQRIYKNDKTAVFFDARPADDFGMGSIPGAVNLTADAALKVKGSPMPLDDFDTRIVLFGRDGEQARALADALGKRPWHNVMYYPGTYKEISAALTAK